MTEPLEIEFPPDPGFARTLRGSLRASLSGMGVSEDRLDFVLLVVDEIVNNAIEHSAAYRADGKLLLRMTAKGRDVWLNFEDPDVPGEVITELSQVLSGPADDVPPLDSERGRGLFLIAMNVEELEVDQRPQGGMVLRGRFPDALA